MATNLLPTHSFLAPSTTTFRRKTAVNSTSGKWWTPIFGWSSDVDYIDSSSKDENPAKSDNIPAKPRFSPGSFTEEKAKQLRLMTKDTAAFHDVMYHSAIASRLASDFSGRNSDDR
ncbi:uncharacterized protein LOC104902108 [Beta vulgaris subsp. vulgaris]|uniref:uncharacterized protein LOC104902108 n=1 Tax=Beta vulgaris subsp. vulgaris TaxID=3555 RepID=UPI0020373D70|nr:uncharacterized protein LOC104902108 [Beta vulgaris subsp. vulgaris]